MIKVIIKIKNLKLKNMINITKTFKTLDTKTHTVRVIRKKETLKKNTSWWYPEKNIDKYYSSFLNDDHYIYSFLTTHSAENCIKFLKKYKSVNNFYPDIELKSFVAPSREVDYGLYIEEETVYNIKKKCFLNNIGIIAITDFEYIHTTNLGCPGIFNICICGVDLLEDQQFDTEIQKEHFNYLFEN